MSEYSRDLILALRSIRRNYFSSAIIIISLALGIGLNTTLFRLVDELFLATPSRAPKPDHLHRVYFSYRSANANGKPVAATSYPLLETIRDRATTFSDVAGYYPLTVSVGSGTDAQDAGSQVVSPTYFELLGSAAEFGRLFSKEDHEGSVEPTIVVSQALAVKYFGLARGAVGQHVIVDGVRRGVIGVMPNDFNGTDVQKIDIWLPLAAAEKGLGKGVLRNPNAYWIRIIARRREGASIDAAAAQVTSAAAAAQANNPGPPRGVKAIVAPLSIARGPEQTAAMRLSIWLAVLSCLVVLLSCGNAACLLIFSAIGRTRETAVRRALGASTLTVARIPVVESIVLTLAGVGLAIVFTVVLSSPARALLLGPTSTSSPVDARLLLYSAAIACCTGILCALAPVAVVLRTELAASLKSGLVGSRGTPRRFRRLLVFVQICLATILVVGAGLFSESLRHVNSVDLGMDTDHLVLIKAEFSGDVRRAERLALYQEMINRIVSSPSVASASLVLGAPTAGPG